MGITRTVTTRVHCDVCGEWVTGWESEGIGISREWAKYFVRLQGCTAGKRIICKEYVLPFLKIFYMQNLVSLRLWKCSQ